MRPLLIVGAGGFGRETAALVEAINQVTPTWNLLGFVDDDARLANATVQELLVRGNLAWLASQKDLFYVLALGSPRIRRALAARLADAMLTPATLIHPTADRHATSTINPGSIICRNVTITVSAYIGHHTIVNLHATIGHDARLGDFTTVHPGVHISGDAQTGAAVELGTGAVLLPGKRVGEETIVGAGAVVNRDLPARCTAIGVPARPITL